MSECLPNPAFPLSWFFDPKIFAVERETVFATAPEYAGCAGIVPDHGSFMTLASSDHTEMLVRNGEDVHLISNVCRHREMLVMKGQGQAKALICPMHRWTYDLGGRLLHAPEYPRRPCLLLPERRLQRWNGIFFAGDRDVATDLAPLGSRPDLDIGHYVFAGRREEIYPVNWKILLEVFYDTKHVRNIHPGFARFQSPATIVGTAISAERMDYEEVRAHPEFAANPASPRWEAWQKCILRLNGERAPERAIRYLVHFPHLIFEWFPYTLFVYDHRPLSPDSTLVINDFFHDPEAVAAEPQLPALARAAWEETWGEDVAVTGGIHRARRARYRREPQGVSGWRDYLPDESGQARYLNFVKDAILRGL
jgi:phenylpropionate dioxygenase-like ring-hydroxylating dioxygenase large terminal subunit